MITVLSLALFLLVWSQIDTWQRSNFLSDEKSQTTDELSLHGSALSLAVNQRVALLNGLQQYVITELKSFEELTAYEFDIFAAGLYSSADGIRNLTLSPGGVNKYVYPLEGNESVIGHDLINDERPDVRADVQRAIQTRQIAISGPYELRQGGLGLVARLAVYADDTFWGLVIIVLDMLPIMQETSLEESGMDIEIAVRDSSGNVFYGDSTIFGEKPVTASIPLPEGNWELAAMPVGGWDYAIRGGLWLFRGVSLGFVGLLTVIVYLIANRQRSLIADVELRTQELMLANRDLEEEVIERTRTEDALRENENRYRLLTENTRDVVFRTRITDATYEYVSPSSFEAFGYEPYEFYDDPQLLLEVLPQGWDIYFRDKWAEILDGHLPQTYEFPIIHKRTGETRWMHQSNVWITGENGELIALQGRVADITERKQMEEALTKSEEIYRITAEKTGQMVYDYNPATGEVKWEGAVEAITGCTKEEFQPVDVHGWANLIHPDNREDALRALDEAQRKCSSYDVEYRFLQRNGNYIYVEEHGVFLPDAEGNAYRMLGSINDITERKRTEVALRTEKEYSESIVNTAQVIILVLDTEGRIVSFNPYMEEVSGYRIEEVAGKDWFATFLPEYDQEHIRRLFRQAISNIQTQGNVNTIVTKTGEERDIEWYDKTLKDAEGNVMGLLSTGQDITERKQAEEALSESEKRFSTIFNESPIPASLTQMSDSKLTEVNDAWCKLMGVSEGDAIAHTVEELNIIDQKTRYRIRDEYLREGYLKHFEATITRRNGEKREIIMSVENLSISGDKFALSLIVDVTESKLAEEKLEQTVEDLQHSNKELEQFAYIASHDLQEPLRMVASYVQLLQKRYKDQLDQDANDFINFAADGAIRMQQMILDILEYSRVGTKGREFESVDLNTVFKEAIANLESQIKDSGAHVISDELPHVLADEIQMTQLLQNLISNAIKFRSENTPQINISCNADNGEWIISVKDNGVGIPHEYQDTVFAVFKRLHSVAQYPGSGIGLSIAAKIVDRHGGKIWVESEPGEGSTFFFSIPNK